MPWFYPGGFRYTEYSDCGYIAPNGKNRPAMDEYLKVREQFGEKRQEVPVLEIVDADPDGELSHWCNYVFGNGVFSKFAFDHARLIDGKLLKDTRVPGCGILAADRTRKMGGTFRFRLAGSDTTSKNTPLLLCGNSEYQGCGPLKYLNGEFNTVTLSNENGSYEITNGGSYFLPAGTYRLTADVGNIAPAKWLHGEADGCVVLKCDDQIYSLQKDVGYLEDGTLQGVFAVETDKTVCLRLAALRRAEFGEVFLFRVQVMQNA